MEHKILRYSLLFLIIILSVSCTQDKEILAPQVVISDGSKYNFESGLTDGWCPSGDSDSKSIKECYAVSTTSAAGNYSLQMSTKLISQSDDYSQGEIYVDMRKYRPFGVSKVPLDLNKKTVSLWLYIPGELSGPGTAPNGMQFFVRDKDYKNWYSIWKNIGSPVATNTWYKLDVKISTASGDYALMDSDFDPQNIIIIGVKMATSASSSNVNAENSFYIDAITW